MPNYFEENPCLANLNLSFDQTLNTSFEEQLKSALFGLFAACKERVKVALVDHEKRIQDAEERNRKNQEKVTQIH